MGTQEREDAPGLIGTWVWNRMVVAVDRAERVFWTERLPKLVPAPWPGYEAPDGWAERERKP